MLKTGCAQRFIIKDILFIVSNFFFKIYSFLATLGLHCHTRTFLVIVSQHYSPLRCGDFSLWWVFLLQSTGSRVQARELQCMGLNCPVACGIEPGIEPVPLHWQADSSALEHQESPNSFVFCLFFYFLI